MTLLERIVSENAPALDERKAQHPVEEVEAAALASPPARSLALALQSEEVSVIAEVKKASPSKGVFRRRFDAVELARTYAAYGAAAISVLTEPLFFQGSLTTLRRIVHALGESHPPVLRKDFIVDLYQVFEARACGADCILLIVNLLDDRNLESLLSLSHELGMDCLVEVHDEAELERALKTDSRVIGINNRDLHTFEVDLATFDRLAPLVPRGCVLVAESGIHDAQDVQRVRHRGADAVLVGEALVMASNAGVKLRELKCIV